jgi:hypothetical protein
VLAVSSSANSAAAAGQSRGRNRINPRIRTSPGAPARTQLIESRSRTI